MTKKYRMNLRVIDVSAKARELFGTEVMQQLAPHRDPLLPDYRFEIDTPTGGEVTFNRYATAEHVMAYVEREGWGVGDQLGKSK